MLSLMDLLKDEEPKNPDLGTAQPETAPPQSEQRIIKREMDSKIIGQVELVFNLDDPETVLVDGVRYTNQELKDLLSHNMDAEKMRSVHNVKKNFEGSILADSQSKEINSRAYTLSRW